MSLNNLRIIYQNVADLTTTTVTASSTKSAATPISNMLKDSKSLVWRSADNSSLSNVRANILLDLGSETQVGGIVLPFTNLSPNATIRVVLHSSSASGTAPTLVVSTPDTTSVTNGSNVVLNTGFVNACPYQVLGKWNWGSMPLGVNAYSYGGGTYARVWFPTVLTGRWVTIEIIDNRSGIPGYTDLFVEVSRIVLGSYWSPKYNTSFGLATHMKDLSTHERTESGDLVTNRGTRFNSMNFDLKWLVPADRVEFTRIIRGGGLPRPTLISLFPFIYTDNPDGVEFEKEQTHQIYGKLSELSAVSHPVFDMYSTTIDIEEI